MPFKETVFIVGAGAGFDFKMPTGADLIQVIAKDTCFTDLNSETSSRGCATLFHDLVNSRANSAQQLFVAGGLISSGIRFSRSVDDFLYNHGNDEWVVLTGKTAIASAILKAERKSHLIGLISHNQFERERAFDTLSASWLHKLTAHMTTGIRRDHLDDLFSGIKIINFNYDRCIETYLHQAIQRAYGVSENEATKTMRTLDISHPYGTVGRLPWQEGDSQQVQFGQPIEDVDLAKLGGSIKTFTEQAHGDDERMAWAQAINEAKRLVFLGFGFHKQNCELIRSAPRQPNGYYPVYTFATAFGTSESDQAVFNQRINEVKGSDDGINTIAPLGCDRFMDEFGLTLSQ